MIEQPVPALQANLPLLAEALRRVGARLIVEGGRVVGVVSDRDIVARVVAAGRDPGSTRVEDIDTHDLVTVGPDADVDEARRPMAQHRLDRVLVVGGDRLVGIISESDVRSDEGPLA